jgi:hypothetical protein
VALQRWPLGVLCYGHALNTNTRLSNLRMVCGLDIGGRSVCAVVDDGWEIRRSTPCWESGDHMDEVYVLV